MANKERGLIDRKITYTNPEKSNWQWARTALKIVSYATVIFPLLMLGVKMGDRFFSGKILSQAEIIPLHTPLQEDINQPDQSEKRDVQNDLRVKLDERSLECFEINPTLPKQKLHVDQDKIFPKDINNNSGIIINIPKEVQNSLDIIFGMENVVSRIPICEKIVDDSFSTASDLPYPIMKAMDKFNTPCIFIKLKVADPEEYYNKHSAESMAIVAKHEVSQNNKITIESALSQLKEKELKRIKAETHVLTLGQVYRAGAPLLWGPREDYYAHREPSFLCKKGMLYIDQITYSEDGAVIESLKDKIPEFQKLFKEEGVGSDVFENRWILALD